MNGVMISILICTRNRAKHLRQTLEAIGRVRVPTDAPTEVVVIDNASSDDTGAVATEAHLSNGLCVRHVSEPRAGKGYAYNHGLAVANGEVLLFTDDDVRPSDDWIDGMCRPILENQADAVAGGVRLAKHLERPWLAGELRCWVACTEGAVDVNVPGCVVGANMAFSRRVLARVPQFDPALGPGALGFYDEALFWGQIVRAGFRVVGRPEVAVEHHFDAERLTTREFRNVAAKLGASLAYYHYHWTHKRVRLPRLKALWYAGQIWAAELASRIRRSESAQPALEDLNRRFQLSLVRQYAKESRGPRNYDQYGLVKRNHGAAAGDRATSPPPAGVVTAATGI